jgi:hypothetical protein
MVAEQKMMCLSVVISIIQMVYEEFTLIPLAYITPVFLGEPGETYIDYIVFTLIETFEAGIET